MGQRAALREVKIIIPRLNAHTHPCSRIPSSLFCATALLQAHHELGRRRTSTPSHTKLIQQDDNPFATHGIPVLISPSRSLRSTCRVSYVRKNGEFISEFCAVTNVLSLITLASPFHVNPASPNLCCTAHRTDRLPPLIARLAEVRIRSLIEQHMLGHSCLYRQQNTEKRKAMSVRETVRVVCTTCAHQESMT